jgi:exopolysaccharide biosynthesis polyprenyl glycosylphosphotransferase
VALRKPVEIELPARVGVSPRLPLREVVPVLDAVALVVAILLWGAEPLAITFGGLTFAALNADASRAYRLDPRAGEEMGWLLTRMVVPLLVLVSAASLHLLPWLGRARDLDQLVLTGSTAVVLVLIARTAAYATGRAARARGIVSEPTLIIGSGRLGVELADALGRHPEYGLRPIGFLDGPPAEDLPLPLLGEPHDLGRVVDQLGVRRVVVAFGRGSERDMAMLLRGLEELPIEVHVVPRFFELGFTPPGADDVHGIPLVHLRRPALRPFGRLSKRAFDVVFSSVMLVLTAPILLIAAVAVRISSPGPVLFRQTRVGKSGRPFKILKFRTLLVNELSDTGWSAQDDHLTPMGRLLRRTSIDELPQLLNVLRGDMSLVGPRPERPYFVERFSASIPGYEDRLRVEGGITGLAQIHGRSRGLDSIPERVRLDNAYIDTWSLWGDLVIMLRTFGLISRGDSDCE